MTIRTLRIELKANGLSLSGNKATLQDRLRKHLSSVSSVAVESEGSEQPSGGGSSLLRRLSDSFSAASSSLSALLFSPAREAEREVEEFTTSGQPEDSPGEWSGADPETDSSSDSSTDSGSESDSESEREGRTDASCYVTEISISPGGMRRGEIFIATDLNEALEPLRWEFDARPMGFAAACQVFCDGTTCVYVIEDGKLAGTVDVKPFVFVSIPRLDIHDERLSDVYERQRQSYEEEADQTNIFCTEAAEEVSMELLEDCEGQTDTVKFRVDWPGLHAAFDDLQLTSNLLQPGETFFFDTDTDEFENTYMGCAVRRGGRIGYNDYEGGIERLCSPETMQLTTYTKSAAQWEKGQ
eukprot:CAMPEP_0114622762 /NCGR_PEP_ID=MMETSP0168-20121206/9902_1 /TAXON_ID=95228 ORGANISM="Vannella sp., Strain DIVA3 517/6/12" /NCGR_SAMPLE_ID=MMETSP0168 /ASSEMBLY_ACC=CAM_ASM_000044 /LENGTH=354 /DNA_ID=CAMNT_0001833983 /DNA_START=16 /DNA_END=1080 /DNA_ORIENTATION=+